MSEVWERQADETPPAYQAFQAFRDAGPDRSLEGARVAVGKSIQMIKRWSAAHDWLSRAAAYDAQLEKVRLKEVERREERRAARWNRRRSRHTDREYRLAQRALDRAERALEGEETPAADGQPAFKVPPSIIDLRRIVSVIAQASAVARKAIEAETGISMEPADPLPPKELGPPAPKLVFVDRRDPRPGSTEDNSDPGAPANLGL